LPAYSIIQEVGDEFQKTDKKFCLILGETGSGKTTQVPQFLYQKINLSNDRIICVQPRKIAAKSLAKRVAEELGVELGGKVGYQVGPKKSSKTNSRDIEHDDCLYNYNTKILFVTESILLKKIANECKSKKRSKFFGNVRAILLDEIHERSLFSDLIFGMLKTTFLDLYPDMKIFLASATVDVEKFRRYFDNCRDIKIPGRTFPVQIIYKPMFEENYVEGGIEVLKEIMDKKKKGDPNYHGHMIMFLTGVDEMEEVNDLIKNLTKKFINDFNDNYVVYFLHGRLSNDEQKTIFDTTETRTKIILATKLAESSITIDGVKIVIDSGYDKDSYYDSKKGINILEIDWISKASAQQRAGRAGRTAPGICYRLYSEDTFYRLEASKKPEIAKVNLDIALLRIIDFGFNNPLVFPYFEPPEKQVIKNTLKALSILGALDSNNKITSEGKFMMEMSTEPRKTKAIIQACQRDCFDEVLEILAMEAHERSLFFIPQDKEERKKFRKSRIGDDGPFQSDHLDFLHIYQIWKNQTKNSTSEWAKKNYLKTRTLENVKRMVIDLKKEVSFMRMKNQEIEELLKPNTKMLDPKQLKISILKCLTASFLLGLAKFSGIRNLGFMNILDGFLFQLHISSNQKEYQPQITDISKKFVIYSQMENPKGLNLAKTISFVDSSWLDDETIIPLHFKNEFTSCLKKNYIYEQTHFELPSWAIRKFKTMFRHRIDQWVNIMEQENHIVKVIPSTDTMMTFVHSKNIQGQIIQFYNILKKEFDVEIAKESIVYNLNDTNYIPIIKDGLVISDILLPKEYITVSYNYLPPNLSKEQVMIALKLQEKYVHYVTVNSQGDHTSGNIRFLDKKTAEIFFERNQQNIHRKVLELQPIYPYSGNKMLLESCQIKATFTLSKSKCEARVSFENEYDAEKALHRLSRNSMIDGSKVSVKVDKKNPSSFFIKDLNPLTDEDILKNYVNGDLSLPKIVVFREDSRSFNDEDRFMFNSLFTKYLTPDEIQNMYFTFKQSKNGHRVKGFVSLPSREIAEKVVNENDGKAGVFGTQRLRIKVENSTTLKVKKNIFIIMEWVLHRRAQEIKERNPEVEICIDTSEKVKNPEKSQSFYKIKVRSKNFGLNRNIANQFERLLKGEEFYGNNHEDEMKLFTVEMKEFYQKYQNQTNKNAQVLYIEWDYATKKVVLHSPWTEVVKKAKNAIQEALDSNIKFECIDIRTYNIKKIRSSLATHFLDDEGFSDVKFDYIKKKLFIKGDQKYIGEWKNWLSQFLLSNVTQSPLSCPICFEELKDNFCVLYNCLHKFCKECFTQHVESEAQKPTISCPIPDCKKIIALKDIKEVLSTHAIHKIIDQHILLYMRAKSNIYKNCPTPDCKYIYLAGAETFKCEGCTESYCVKDPNSTHKEHPGETCRQFKNNNDVEKKFQEMIQKGEIKIAKCCKIPVSKVEGCNHITCKQCQKHYCWECLAVFDTADETYRHMGECRGRRF